MNTTEFMVISEAEALYPETTANFKKFQQEQYLTFCKKQLDYGPGNISVGTECRTEDDIKLSLTGLWFRMADKINRLKQMVVLDKNAMVEDESIFDTYQDLANYSTIAQIVFRGEWGK